MFIMSPSCVKTNLKNTKKIFVMAPKFDWLYRMRKTAKMKQQWRPQKTLRTVKSDESKAKSIERQMNHETYFVRKNIAIAVILSHSRCKLEIANNPVSKHKLWMNMQWKMQFEVLLIKYYVHDLQNLRNRGNKLSLYG